MLDVTVLNNSAAYLLNLRDKRLLL